MYAYGHVGYLMAGIAGQANGTPDAKYSGGWEEAYAGIVGGGITAAGTSWQYNVSYGLQSYCIGGAMLMCQIASSSGERAGDFTWPRWSRSQLPEGAVPGQQHHGRRLSLRAERLPAQPHAHRRRQRPARPRVRHHVRRSRGSPCSTPTRCTTCPPATTLPRDGMRALQVRARLHAGARRGRARSARWSGRGRPTRTSRCRRSAPASKAAGRSPARSGRPTITYRWTTLGGDDPSTRTFERWDLFYSGGDIDTWVQGQLMKNIHYNSNVRMQRVLGRLRLGPTWRFTGSFSDFRANELNNLGGVISHAGRRGHRARVAVRVGAHAVAGRLRPRHPGDAVARLGRARHPARAGGQPVAGRHCQPQHPVLIGHVATMSPTLNPQPKDAADSGHHQRRHQRRHRLQRSPGSAQPFR